MRVPSTIALLISLSCCAAVTAEEAPFPYDAERPELGLWVGTFTPPGGQPTFAAVSIQSGRNETIATVDAPGAGMVGTESSRVAQTGDGLEVTVPGPGAKLVFVGPVSDDGQRWSGVLAVDRGGTSPGPGSFAFERSALPTSLPEPLAYAGALRVPGLGPLKMALVIAEGPGGRWVGHVDVPVQGVTGFPTESLDVDGDRVVARLAFRPPAVIEGSLEDGRTRLRGVFKQAGIELPIDFERDEAYTDGALPRPQHPVPPFPYREEAFTVPRGEFSLAGTLSLPDPDAHGPGPYALAVLVSGSGQQDRDETLVGHKPFLVIADALARAGIAVARYDDRGVGGSQVPDMALVENATTADFAEDAGAVIKHLARHDAIDAARVGIVGHSEGGAIALLVAGADPDFGFVVLMAGPGVVGHELLVRQTQLGWELAGLPADLIEKLTPAYEALLTRVADGAEREEVLDGLREMAQMQREAIGVGGLNEAQVEASLEMQSRILANAWMQWFLTYDPQPALAQLRCPVFAMNGTKDRQVWHEQNLDAIEDALAKRESKAPVTIKRYEGLNHLFQPAPTGSPIEYGIIETTIDEQVLEDLAAWINEVAPIADEVPGTYIDLPF